MVTSQKPFDIYEETIMELQLLLLMDATGSM